MRHTAVTPLAGGGTRTHRRLTVPSSWSRDPVLNVTRHYEPHSSRTGDARLRHNGAAAAGGKRVVRRRQVRRPRAGRWFVRRRRRLRRPRDDTDLRGVAASSGAAAPPTLAAARRRGRRRRRARRRTRPAAVGGADDDAARTRRGGAGVGARQDRCPAEQLRQRTVTSSWSSERVLTRHVIPSNLTPFPPEQLRPFSRRLAGGGPRRDFDRSFLSG